MKNKLYEVYKRKQGIKVLSYVDNKEALKRDIEYYSRYGTKVYYRIIREANH